VVKDERFWYFWSSLPAIEKSSGVSLLLMPNTISMFVSAALGMLLSLRWIDWRVFDLAKGHYSAFTLSRKFIPDTLRSMSFEEAVII